MKHTLQTAEAICKLLHREAGVRCCSRHVHGDVLGNAAVVIVALEFPEGNRYLLQLTKLMREEEVSSLFTKEEQNPSA